MKLKKTAQPWAVLLLPFFSDTGVFSVNYVAVKVWFIFAHLQPVEHGPSARENTAPTRYVRDTFIPAFIDLFTHSARGLRNGCFLGSRNLEFSSEPFLVQLTGS